jgi:hypothetical protein
MKIIEEDQIPGVIYWVRHWGKWYWVTGTGQFVRVGGAFKKAIQLGEGDE